MGIKIERGQDPSSSELEDRRAEIEANREAYLFAVAAMMQEATGVASALAGDVRLAEGGSIVLEGSIFRISLSLAGDEPAPAPTPRPAPASPATEDGGARAALAAIDAYIDSVDPDDRRPGEDLVARVRRVVEFLRSGSAF